MTIAIRLNVNDSQANFNFTSPSHPMDLLFQAKDSTPANLPLFGYGLWRRDTELKNESIESVEGDRWWWEVLRDKYEEGNQH